MTQLGLKIVFASTPEFGLPALNALFSSRHTVCAVYTQPDRPSGRGRHRQGSPVKQWALAHAVPVYQPLHFRDEAVLETLRAFAPDLMVVIAYGQLLPKSVLTIPRLGCINVHASLLPAWRGASPIQSAILNGDRQTGVSIMQLDEGMDSGPVFKQAIIPISETETAQSLHDRLAALSVAPLLEVLDDLEQHRAHAIPQQDTQATYAKKLHKDAAYIHWHQAALNIERMIRAYDPWPIAYTTCGTERIRIFEATVMKGGVAAGVPGEILKVDATGITVATGDDLLLIRTLQFAGGRRLAVRAWYHARSPNLCVGQRFGTGHPR